MESAFVRWAEHFRSCRVCFEAKPLPGMFEKLCPEGKEIIAQADDELRGELQSHCTFCKRPVYKHCTIM